MRRFGTSVAAVLFLAAAARAQDVKSDPAPPAEEHLILKAHVKGPLKDDVWKSLIVMPWPDDAGPPAGSSKSTSNLHIDTDAGTLRCDITGGAHIGGPGRVELFFLGHRELGMVVVHRDVLRGEVDLGDVAFGEAAPVVASGHVLSESGAPQLGVDLHLVLQIAPGSTRTFSELGATTDASGAFVLRGDLRGFEGETSLSISGRWKSEKPTTFVLGAKDLKIVVSRLAGVHGMMEIPPGVAWEDLVVVMKGPPHGTDDVVMPDTPSYGHGGTDDRLEFSARPQFDVERLLPGVYDVRVKFRGATKPLLRLPEVTIDENTTDLPLLSVTKSVKHALVHVAAADGSPAKGARLFVRDVGDRGQFREVKLDAKSAADVAFVDGLELVAHAAGTDYVRATTSGAETTLSPAAVATSTVTTTLPAGAPTSSKDKDAKLCAAFEWRAPADVPRAAIEAVADDTDPRTEVKYEASFAADGRAVATLPLPGWYRVHLWGRRPNRSVGRTLDAVLVASPAVTVAVPLSAQEIQDLLDGDPFPNLPKPPR